MCANVRGLFFCSYISEPSLGRALFEQYRGGGVSRPLFFYFFIFFFSGRLVVVLWSTRWMLSLFRSHFSLPAGLTPWAPCPAFKLVWGAGGCASSHHQLLTSPLFNSQIKKSALSLPHRSLNTIYMAHLTTSLLHSSTQVAFVQSLFKLIPLFLMSCLVTMFSAPVPGWARPEADVSVCLKSKAPYRMLLSEQVILKPSLALEQM